MQIWWIRHSRPEYDAPPGVILSYFADRDTVIFGSFLLMLAAVLFLLFVGCLRAVLRRAEEVSEA